MDNPNNLSAHSKLRYLKLSSLRSNAHTNRTICSQDSIDEAQELLHEQDVPLDLLVSGTSHSFRHTQCHTGTQTALSQNPPIGMSPALSSAGASLLLATSSGRLSPPTHSNTLSAVQTSPSSGLPMRLFDKGQLPRRCFKRSISLATPQHYGNHSVRRDLRLFSPFEQRRRQPDSFE